MYISSASLHVFALSTPTRRRRFAFRGPAADAVGPRALRSALSALPSRSSRSCRLRLRLRLTSRLADAALPGPTLCSYSSATMPDPTLFKVTKVPEGGDYVNDVYAKFAIDSTPQRFQQG